MQNTKLRQLFMSKNDHQVFRGHQYQFANMYDLWHARPIIIVHHKQDNADKGQDTAWNHNGVGFKTRCLVGLRFGNMYGSRYTYLYLSVHTLAEIWFHNNNTQSCRVLHRACASLATTWISLHLFGTCRQDLFGTCRHAFVWTCGGSARDP